MIWQTIKKQGKLFLRNPQHLQLIVGLPILLIGILGFALGGFMSGETTSSFEIDVALIDDGNEQEQVARFMQDVEDSSLPSEAKAAIRENASQFAPVERLKDAVSGDLQDVLRVDMAAPSEKSDILNGDNYAAVIEIPENFTYDTLRHRFIEEDDAAATLQVYQNEDNQLRSSIIVDVVTQFQEQMSLMAFAGEHDISQEAMQVDQAAITGETESISQGNPVGATTYYGIGMAVLHVLFIATTIGYWAFYDKKAHVFNRVIVGNISRWTYLSGIFAAGAVYGFVHLLTVFGISRMLYGITWPNLSALLIVTLALALAIGGLATLLSAISYRIDSITITNLFNTFIAYIFAFIGGSFFPIGDFSKIIRMIGNFTPNGAGMTAYLTVMRGGGISEISSYLFFLVLFGVVMFAIAALSFPKRGGEI